MDPIGQPIGADRERVLRQIALDRVRFRISVVSLFTPEMETPGAPVGVDHLIRSLACAHRGFDQESFPWVRSCEVNRGAGTRTLNLRLKRPLLYRLSYSPIADQWDRNTGQTRFHAGQRDSVRTDFVEITPPIRPQRSEAAN